MSKNGGEERFSHILIFSRIFLDIMYNFKLRLGKITINLLPYLLLVILCLHRILINLLIFFLSHKLVELVVFYFDVYGTENEFVAEISNSFEPAYSTLRLGHASRFIAASCQLSLLSRFEHAWKFRQHTKIANNLTYISRLSLLSKLIPQYNINRSRHGTWWYFGWIFLHSQFLEVRELWFRHL